MAKVTTPATVEFSDEIVDVSSLNRTKRGRVATVNKALETLLADLPIDAKKARPLGSIFGQVEDKVGQAKVRGQITAHFNRVRSDAKCSVGWTIENVPFVTAKPLA